MSCCGKKKKRAIIPIIQGFVYDAVGINKKLGEYRLQYCLQPCEQLKTTYFGPKCKLCGCYVTKKTKVPEEECPIKKWLKVTTE